MRLPTTLSAAGYKYRPLKNGDRGWDVYALQSALIELGYPTGGLDGIWGAATETAVRNFQRDKKLTVDGIAGVVTQRTLALVLIWPLKRQFNIPPGLQRGQVEFESAFMLGNHSPAYHQDGHGPFWDVGVAQHSSRYTPFSDGFNAPASLHRLSAQLRAKYDEYRRIDVVKDERRLWELASGSWNAPAWTDQLARGRQITASQRAHIEEYIRRATVYLEI